MRSILQSNQLTNIKFMSNLLSSCLRQMYTIVAEKLMVLSEDRISTIMITYSLHNIYKIRPKHLLFFFIQSCIILEGLFIIE